MRSHHAVVLLMAAAGVVGAYLLLPRHEERATMLRRDGHLERALLELEGLRARGDERPHIIQQLAELNADAGFVERAIELFEGYLSQRPDDVETRDKLALLYRDNQRRDLQLAALESNFRLQPSAPRLSGLLAAYRLDGRYGDEERLLTGNLQSGFLGVSDLERAGALLAAKRDYPHALSALVAAETLSPPDAEPGRLLLAGTLLQSGRFGEAKSLAKRWIASWSTLAPSLTLCGLFADAGQSETVIEIVTDLRTKRSKEPVEQHAASRLARDGHRGLARRVLELWVERLDGVAVVADAELRRFVEVAVASDAMDIGLLWLERLIGRREEARAAALAEQIGTSFGMVSLSGIASLHSSHVLEVNPIFGAELSLFNGNPELARRILSNVDLSRLSRDHKMLWLSAMKRVAPETAIYSRMDRDWRSGTLPVELHAPFAELASRLGRVEVHTAVWRGLAKVAAR